jgi:hypothetical protein
MTKRVPAYTALVNKHLRFYFSNPDRERFESKVDQKQFCAVRKIINTLSENQQIIMKIVMIPKIVQTNGDRYIGENITCRIVKHIGR